MVAIEPFATDGPGYVPKRVRRGLPARPRRSPSTGRAAPRRGGGDPRAFAACPSRGASSRALRGAGGRETRSAWLRRRGAPDGLPAAGGEERPAGGPGRAHDLRGPGAGRGADPLGRGTSSRPPVFGRRSPRRGGRRAGAGGPGRCRRCRDPPRRGLAVDLHPGLLALDPLGRLLARALLPRDLLLPLRERRSSSIGHRLAPALRAIQGPSERRDFITARRRADVIERPGGTRPSDSRLVYSTKADASSEYRSEPRKARGGARADPRLPAQRHPHHPRPARVRRLVTVVIGPAGHAGRGGGARQGS